MRVCLLSPVLTSQPKDFTLWLLLLFLPVKWGTRALIAHMIASLLCGLLTWHQPLLSNSNSYEQPCKSIPKRTCYKCSSRWKTASTSLYFSSYNQTFCVSPAFLFPYPTFPLVLSSSFSEHIKPNLILPVSTAVIWNLYIGQPHIIKNCCVNPKIPRPQLVAYLFKIIFNTINSRARK